jgi:hypothetical protein
MDLDIKTELLKKKQTVANYVRTEIWVYKVDKAGEMALLPNQPFKTKREALRVLGIHLSVLNKHLDTSKMFRDLLFLLLHVNKNIN